MPATDSTSPTAIDVPAPARAEKTASTGLPTELFPLRLLGMGLVFAWDWSLSTDLQVVTGSSWDFGSINLCIIVAEVVALIAFAMLTSRLGALSRHRGVVAAASVVGAVGPIALVTLQHLSVHALLPESLAAAAFVVIPLALGFSVAVLTLMWAEVYGRMEPGAVILYGSLSLLFGTAAYGVVSQSSLEMRAVCTAAIPAASFVMCRLSLSSTGMESLDGRAGARYTFPWKPVLIMGVCGFAAAFVDVALFEQGTLPHILADCICGGALALVVAVLRRSVRPVALVGVSLATMAVGIVAVALIGARAAFTASLLAMLSYVVITFFTYALLANKCYRHDIPSLWIFGFAVAARVAADHLGGFARMAFPQLGGMTSSRLDLALMAVVGLLAIGVVALVWMSERSFNSSWAIERIDARATTSQRSDQEVLLAGCERLAKTAGLTERESEILGMLVAGDTYQQICSTLLLSPNTVKTHARHVYGKLGVHTREEAMEMARANGR